MDSIRLFPCIDRIEEFDAIARDETVLRPGAVAVCEELGIRDPDPTRFPGGSLPVYAVNDGLVLKLFPPCDLEAWRRERQVLEILHGRLPVETPRVVAAGEREGWGYVLMSRLPGELLDSVWPRLAGSDRHRLAVRLGEALAALHELRDPRLSSLRSDWSGFLAAQRGSAVSRQHRRGLDPFWLEQIEPFLEDVHLPSSPDGSLLHTEVMREHLLVETGNGPPFLSGTFDFEPSMVGAPEYEFAAVGLFVTGGDPFLLRALLLAYGYAPHELDEDLQRRFLAYALLHRYCHLRWYLERLPPPPGVRTLQTLAGHWWNLP